MKRKWFSVFLTLAVLLSIIPLGAVTAYAVNVGDTFTENNSEGVAIKYKVTDAINLTVEVKANSYSAATVNIPATVSDGTSTYTVTSIGGSAFSGCTSLAAITVDANNTHFTCVDGVLFNSGKSKLLAYPNAKGSSYTIPDGVTSIGDSAFYDCTSLTGITIPAGITSIGDSEFTGCTSLAAITVDANNACFTSVDGVLFDHSQSTLLAYPNAKGNSYTIPVGVTLIGDGAFEYCPSLESVTIPTGVRSIGDGAFYNCPSLASVYFDGDKPAIGVSVFITNTTTTLYYKKGYTYPAAIDSQSCVGKTAYAVTVDPGIVNGTVTPSTANGIPGETITLTVAPASGYALKTLTCTSNNATITGHYYFTMPDAAVTVSAAFAKIHTVAFNKNGGGTAALPTTNPTRTGYTFAGWNTKTDGSGTAFTASTPVTGDITVYAKWTADSTGGDDDDLSYTITASAGVGGSISPGGSSSIIYGGGKTYTITPTDGYEIKDVLVDGVSVGAVSSYTFENVKKAHTISASFAKRRPSIRLPT